MIDRRTLVMDHRYLGSFKAATFFLRIVYLIIHKAAESICSEVSVSVARSDAAKLLGASRCSWWLALPCPRAVWGPTLVHCVCMPCRRGQWCTGDLKPQISTWKQNSNKFSIAVHIVEDSSTFRFTTCAQRSPTGAKMSRSPSPTPSNATSRRSSVQDGPLDPPDTPHQSEGLLYNISTPASSALSPQSGFVDRFSRNDRNGAYATLNTPAPRLDLDSLDEESFVRKSSHVTNYERMDSWIELVKAGTVRFAITILFGALLCLCLKAWEGFEGPVALSTADVRMFNAVTIAISICLGLNLLSSLKRYAMILRWSILTKSYVSMEVFDLILGIEELTNVVKLMRLSLPSLRDWKQWTVRPRQWQDVKLGTSRWYAVACALWLLVNIGSQILVASLSLFWPTYPYTCPLTKYGQVAVADLSAWADKPNSSANPWVTAWNFGMDAQHWPVFIDDSVKDLSALPGTPIYKIDDYYEYRFFYRNPNRLYTDYLQSDRSIRSQVACEQYKNLSNVTSATENYNWTHIEGYHEGIQYNMAIPAYGKGGITYIGVLSPDQNETCGPRCSKIMVYQHPDYVSVNTSSYWECKSTVTNIKPTKGQSLANIDPTDPQVFGNDKFARVAAGAISWSGISYGGWGNWNWQLYPKGTYGSPTHIVNTSEVEDIIKRFSIGAIAAYDDHGVRHSIHINNEHCDVNSQRLNVGWRYVTGILGGICLIQFGALCCLLAFANRGIIRDASFFSTAMLLKPVLKLVGDEPGAMTMSGAQLKDHPKLRYRKIRYDYQKGRNGEPNEVMLAMWPKQGRTSSEKWPSGQYW